MAGGRGKVEKGDEDGQTKRKRIKEKEEGGEKERVQEMTNVNGNLNESKVEN